MGVAKIPPPRPSTAEPDHAPQTISEDASLTPPPRQASVTSDERESPCPNRRLTNASRQASVILTSACSHVLIDSVFIPCSSASSPPTRCRLGGSTASVSSCTSSSDGPRQRGRRLQTQSVHVDHRIDEVEPRTARDAQLHRIDPSSAAIVNGPANFGKNLGCSPRSDKCSVDNSTSSPSR
jgi:hypothetical protein